MLSEKQRALEEFESEWKGLRYEGHCRNCQPLYTLLAQVESRQLVFWFSLFIVVELRCLLSGASNWSIIAWYGNFMLPRASTNSEAFVGGKVNVVHIDGLTVPAHKGQTDRQSKSNEYSHSRAVESPPKIVASSTNTRRSRFWDRETESVVGEKQDTNGHVLIAHFIILVQSESVTASVWF